MPKSGTVEWDEINRALALHDTLGIYVEHRYVDRKRVLEAWHHSVRATKEPAIQFIALRQARYRPWPYLRLLFDRAVAHQSRLDCCQPMRIDERKPDPGGDEAVGSPADP